MSTVFERADAFLSLAFVLLGAVIWVRVVPTLAPSKPSRGSSAQRYALGEMFRITFVYGHTDPIVRTTRLLLKAITVLGAGVLGIRLFSA